jgi:hypothetical protein
LLVTASVISIDVPEKTEETGRRFDSARNLIRSDYCERQFYERAWRRNG